MNGAVELQHIFAARHLVQAVDVLGNDGGEDMNLFQLRQLFMGGVWLCGQAEHLFPVKAEELLRVPFKKAVA